MVTEWEQLKLKLLSKNTTNVAEVAVVGKPHEIKGEGIFAYIVLKSDEGIADEVEEVKAINNIIKKR